MEQISISEIQRNLHKLNHFDIIEVVDKKRNKVKGYFLDGKYASLIEEMSEKFLQNTRKNQKSLRGVFSQYADPAKIENEKGAWERHVIKKYSKDD